LFKSCGGKQESKTSIAMAAIKEEGEIILVLATHGEKYVYLDDDKISDDEDSILKVFTSKMEVQLADTNNAYQYAPIIESVKYPEGLDTCSESRPSDDNGEDKSQGGNVSLTRQLYNQPWKLLWTKTCGSRTRDQQVMLQTAKSEVKTIVKQL
jgi:hypothetical protein